MRIRVMPEFCSTGLWDLDHKNMMIDFEELKIPKDLIQEIEKWIDDYDFNYDLDKNYMKDANLMNEEGMKIARKLKYIFPDIYIEYKGENNDGLMESIII